MAKYNSLAALFTAIANAIRSKSGSTANIVAEDFPEAIQNLSSSNLADLVSGFGTGYLNVDLSSEYPIKDYAFYDCQYSSIEANPKGIGTYAFAECKNLTTVKLWIALGTTPFQKGAFQNCSSLTAIIIPFNQLGDYDVKENAFAGTPIASGTGYIYVQAAHYDQCIAAEGMAPYFSQVRVLEDYTVDGTVGGELDPNKI